MVHTPPVEGFTVLQATPAVRAGVPRRRRPRPASWLPPVTLAALVAAVLYRYGVSVRDMLVFGVYVASGLALPGTLLVRALYRGRRTFAEEVALGLALGYAVEVPVYVGARAAGMPLLAAAWPVVVVAAFAAVPGLRRHWRRPAGLERTPLWVSWSSVLVLTYLLAWSALTFFRTHALTWPKMGTVPVDMSFHLALIGEFRHHMPPSVPMVAGEPLLYHWFIYAHYAAASRLTGLEPVLLLFRLGMLPMLAVLVVLVGMTGRLVTRSWAGGALTVAGTVFLAVPSLYLGSNGSFTWGGVPDLAWTSPTQIFGSMLFAPVAVLLLDLLGHRRDAGRWVLLGVFLLAVMGAKATYLPLLGAGLAAVAAVEAVRRRRVPWPALATLGATALLCLFAQLVLFGGASQAVVFSPLFSMRTAWGELTGLGEHARPGPGSVLGITLVYALGWAVVCCGALGLLGRTRELLRPGVVLMLGIGAAGLGTVFLLGHPTRSHYFFLWGAYPYLVAVTVHGLMLLLRRAGIPRKATLFAAGAGVLVAYAVPALCHVVIPLRPGEPGALLYLPYLALAVLTVAAFATLAVRAGALRACALVAVMLAAVGLPADLHARVLKYAGQFAGAVPPTTIEAISVSAVPPATLTAGRWLRDHSAPDDLVATNAHCALGLENPCDNRHFWVAAFSERRVLVEGWGYTASNLRRWHQGELLEHIPFWDGRLIAQNDAAFDAPSAAAMRRLRDLRHVRWLFADERPIARPADIGRFAHLAFRSGDYAVYDLAAPVPPGPRP
ncbi:hypothetical protein [Sphaerisporangium dianthi]|uniref:Glycosyltransferase RgtA/B/C/D-like domain-containing protein n=1 Tax=Sphaerisporangium dianthi TaxID=1436120 RepID=A0ABV9CF61_9ACTN